MIPLPIYPLKKLNNLESQLPLVSALLADFMLDESHFAAKGCSAESLASTTALTFGSPETALSIDSFVAV